MDRNVFPGVYRGIVVNNDDSRERHSKLCRIKVSVPQVYGEGVEDEKLPWAEPCLPMGGGAPSIDPKDYTAGRFQIGMLAIPRVGSSVWVAFEHGDPQHPVWIGTWYGEKDKTPETPDLATESPSDETEGDPVRDGYPDIAIVMPGFKKNGMYIRWKGDKLFEMVYHKDDSDPDADYAYLVFDFRDEDRTKIGLKAKGADIEVGSEEGLVVLENGTADDDNYQRVMLDPNLDKHASDNPADYTLRIEGAKVLISGDYVRIRAREVFQVSAEQSRNSSEQASGFDAH